MAKVSFDEQLAKDISDFYYDPLGFVMYIYEWNSGVLKGFEEPDEWQKEQLRMIGELARGNAFDGVNAVDPIRMATSSGHGIGKSALTAWIIHWIMSTRPFCNGVVTSNTSQQLRTKTWAELERWVNRSINKHWFNINSGTTMKMYHVDYPTTWKVDGITCAKENSESFAGLHAASSTPFYIFDEASGVPDVIWDVAEGGLTDGEPMIFVFGNPTQASGRFHACFHRYKHRWNCSQIDSRTAKLPNKKQIQEWMDDYGEDSDFFKVRVRGVFPSVGSRQMIGSDIVTAARNRNLVPTDIEHAAKVLGVDVARFGDDESVISSRQGLKLFPQIVYKGLDTMELSSRVAEIYNRGCMDAVFVDGCGLGAGVVDRLKQLGVPVVDVQAAGKALNKKYANKTAECWGLMAEWLAAGADIPEDPDLEGQLIGREYGFNTSEQILLESKKDAKRRGMSSPDRADSLGLTFAMPVQRKKDAYQFAGKSYRMNAGSYLDRR